MQFLRDKLIEGGAQLVGMDPVWFCVTLCGTILLGLIVSTEFGLWRKKPPTE